MPPPSLTSGGGVGGGGDDGGSMYVIDTLPSFPLLPAPVFALPAPPEAAAVPKVRVTMVVVMKHAPPLPPVAALLPPA